MANTLDPMDLKQILSLHKDGLSNRKIGNTLGNLPQYRKHLCQAVYKQ